MKSLNVLIGPNASGKSNLIEAIGFLQASPTDLGLPIRDGGGVMEWLWKGSRGTPTAEVNATIYYPQETMPLRHRISFTMVGQRFELADEAVENEHPDEGQSGEVRFYYRYQKGHPVIRKYKQAAKGNRRIRIFLHEDGLHQPMSATRLSDGTLRYLSLLSILCHPSPPPLVCIEEPELGLHPDILPTIAELLMDASQRTQLIVTTQSDILVDAMAEMPDAILVCEKYDGSTAMKRLKKEDLSEWLEKYALGELWRMGEIGGKRW